MPARSLTLIALCIWLASVSAPVFGDEANHSAAPYAGLQARSIKSLSDEDLAELRRGGGWGLALPAELSGKPGPAHILELQNELQLSSDQIQAISAIFEDMRTDAIAAGERFILAEQALSDAFAAPFLDPIRLRALLDEAAAARAELRFIHLSRHLLTPPLLSEAQIQDYIVLRGYAQDTCATVPEGHDAERWRRHNGCN